MSRLSRKYLKEQHPEPGIAFSPKKALEGVTVKMLGDERGIMRCDEVKGWPSWYDRLHCQIIRPSVLASHIIFSCFFIFKLDLFIIYFLMYECPQNYSVLLTYIHVHAYIRVYIPELSCRGF